MKNNRWMALVAVLSLFGAVSVQAVDETSSPAQVPAVQPAVSAPANGKVDLQAVRGDRKKLHQDREKLEADIKQFGKESSQVTQDRELLKQDRIALKSARHQMKQDKKSEDVAPQAN